MAPRTFALLLILSGSAFAATVTRGPALQSVDMTSAVVGVRLDSACPVEIKYGPGEDLSQTAPSGTSATQHFVKLSALQPGSPYRYQVHACGQATTLGGRFTTAPKAGARNIHFAAMGDFGTGGNNQTRVADLMNAAGPEFWLALGDNAYQSGTEAEFDQRFFAPMKPLLANVPVFPSPGNHEYVTNKAQPYLDAFALPNNNAAGSERFYSFDWGAVHVVSLDSMCARGTNSAGCDAATQKAWLAADLAASKAPWKIVIFHHPVYSSGSHGSTPAMQALIPTFEAGGVDLVLTGHDHDYERTKPMKGGVPVPPGTTGAIIYIVVGTGGAGAYGFSSDPEWTGFRNTGILGYLDVKVAGGTLTGSLITTTGDVPDTFTLTKALPAPTVSIVGEPGSGQAPLTANFTAVTDVGDAELSWDFGDGQQATGATVSHTFNGAGTFTVTATAKSGAQVGTATKTVSVTQAGTIGEGTPGPANADAGSAPVTEPQQLPPEAPVASEPEPVQPPPVEVTPGAEEPLPEDQDPQGPGCSATGGMPLLAAALIALATARRRRSP